MTKAEQLVDLLLKKNYRISCAESCTGGKLTAAIVDVADASKVLDASIVTYANEAKEKYVGVERDTLLKFGAVSEETAAEMAKGISKENEAHVGVSVTGIAGPGGGTKEKPVGTVCFGFCINGNTITKTKHFGDLGRNVVRDASVAYALDTLLEIL